MQSPITALHLLRLHVESQGSALHQVSKVIFHNKSSRILSLHTHSFFMSTLPVTGRRGTPGTRYSQFNKRYVRPWIQLTWWVEPFHNVCVCQTIMLHTLSILQLSYLNKAEKTIQVQKEKKKRYKRPGEVYKSGSSHRGHFDEAWWQWATTETCRKRWKVNH